MLNTIHCPASRSISSKSQKPFFLAWFQQLLKMGRNGLKSLNSKAELQVRQHHDRHGYFYWTGYNPTTGQSFSTASEDEMRDWIEKQYLNENYSKS